MFCLLYWKHTAMRCEAPFKLSSKNRNHISRATLTHIQYSAEPRSLSVSLSLPLWCMRVKCIANIFISIFTVNLRSSGGAQPVIFVFLQSDSPVAHSSHPWRAAECDRGHLHTQRRLTIMCEIPSLVVVAERTLVWQNRGVASHSNA